MNWIVVKSLPLNQDLSQLLQHLTARGVVFRVSEKEGRQLLAVQDPQLVEPLAQLVDEFLQGNLDLPKAELKRESQPKGISPWATPVTLLLIVLSALGALMIETEAGQQWAVWFTFLALDDQYQFVSLTDTLVSGQLWRLLTPVFLHFGLFHILFNSLWMWDLGRRVELAQGKFQYIVFFVLTAIASNIVQYIWGGAGLFGGMSGVVYALVGFIWMRQRFAPHPLLAVHSSIIGFMLFWLVLCMTGIVDKFMDGSVANAAHLGGLLAGMILGVVSGLGKRQRE